MSEPDSDTYGRGIAMSALGMLILSPDTLLLRMVSQGSSFWDVLFFRSLFIFLALLAYLAVRHRQGLWGIFTNMGRAGLIATGLMTANNITFVAAIALTSVANVLVMLATMPFFGAVLGWLMIGERVKRRTGISIFLAFIGIVVIFSGSLGKGSGIGDVIALVTAFLMGLNLVLLRKYKGQDVIPQAYCLSGLLVALIVLPLASPALVPFADIKYLMLMGGIVVPVSMVLFFGGARHAPAAEIALLSLIETVLGPIWVWIGVAEVIPTMTFIGGGIVIVAVAGNAWVGLRTGRRKILVP